MLSRYKVLIIYKKKGQALGSPKNARSRCRCHASDNAMPLGKEKDGVLAAQYNFTT